MMSLGEGGKELRDKLFILGLTNPEFGKIWWFTFELLKREF